MALGRMGSLIIVVVVVVLMGSEVRGGAVKEKHCKGEVPADDGYFSHCKGLIKCPAHCPDCHLSCHFCGMLFCPKCNKVGSICQDPRFVGGDGVMFYFHGHRDADFCIVSDRALHINAHFIGKRGEGQSRDFTWVQALGILFGANHRLYVGARRSVAHWVPQHDQFVINLDGKTIALPTKMGYKWKGEVGGGVNSLLDEPHVIVTIVRVATANVVVVEIQGLLNISISIVPVTMEESRIHKYGINEGDCFAHLEVNFNYINLTKFAQGVLGQTYVPSFVSPVKVGAPMPIMGGEHKYLVSSILSPDCQVSRFKERTTNLAANTNLAALTTMIACGSNGVEGEGFVCKK